MKLGKQWITKQEGPTRKQQPTKKPNRILELKNITELKNSIVSEVDSTIQKHNNLSNRTLETTQLEKGKEKRMRVKRA